MSTAFSVTQHYENFPVGSWLIPKDKRGAVASIYWFARSADDIADEGDAPAVARLARLAQYRGALDEIATGVPQEELAFGSLARAIERHRLSIRHFDDLLSAFEQDCQKTRYQDSAELLDYCAHSAKPVGRLMLELFDEASTQNLSASDHICTALQLINFIQDIGADWRKGRCYLPAQDWHTALQTEGNETLESSGAADWEQIMAHDVARGQAGAILRAVIAMQVRRADDHLRLGQRLPNHLRGRFAMEIRLVVAAADRLLARFMAPDFDPLKRVPRLGTWAWVGIGAEALAKRLVRPRQTTPT